VEVEAKEVRSVFGGMGGRERRLIVFWSCFM